MFRHTVVVAGSNTGTSEAFSSLPTLTDGLLALRCWSAAPVAHSHALQHIPGQLIMPGSRAARPAAAVISTCRCGWMDSCEISGSDAQHCIGCIV